MIIHLNSCYFRADNQQPFNFSCAPPREIWVTGLFPEGLDIEGHVFEPTCQVGSSWIYPNGHAKMGEINGNQGLNLGIDMHWWGPNSQNPIWNGKVDYSDDVHGAAIHDRRNGGSVHGHREAGHMARWSCLCHLGLGAICFEAYNYIQQFCWPLSFPNNIDGPWLKCITTPAVVIGHPTYRSRACFKLQRIRECVKSHIDSYRKKGPMINFTRHMLFPPTIPIRPLKTSCHGRMNPPSPVVPLATVSISCLQLL